ncbi:MAG: DUF6364 family protein [Bacteroidota bacterium]
MSSPKLTLSLSKSVIEMGKAYAKEQGTSLSKLVEKLIREEVEPDRSPIQVIPTDEDLRALMNGQSMADTACSNHDYRANYYESRREKYTQEDS